MVNIRYDKLRRSGFYNNVSAKDRVQATNLNQIKLKVNDTYEKDEKVTKNIDPSHDVHKTNKVCLNTNLFNIEGHLSLTEKYYNDLKLRNQKQFEEVLIERAAEMIIQSFQDKVFFDNYDIADEVLGIFLFVPEITGRRRPD